MQRMVSFGQAITLYFKNYFNFNGRSSRSEYWWIALALAIIAIPFCVNYGFIYLNFATGDLSEAEFIAASRGGVWSYIYGLIYLALLLPNIAISCRRLHDTGRGAGWIFISLVPIVGGIWYLVLMLLPSQMGSNRFGPVPNAG